MTKSVLVSGGAGYIGSHTCKILKEQGYLPVTIDNMSTGHKKSCQFGPVIVADISEDDVVRDIINDFQIKDVIHFAADSLVGESMANPLKYYDNNVGVASLFFQTCVNNGVMNFVCSSSASVYGAAYGSLISENHPLQPTNPYGESKLAFERILPWVSAAHRIGYVSLRYFNAAGSDLEGNIGESHNPETHLIPLACDAAYGISLPLTVFGGDYDTPDGTAVRDYVHVTDLAHAHIAALKYLGNGGKSDVFNVGSGEGKSIKEVIDTIERLSGRKVPHTIGERRAGDPPMLVADISKIQAYLGWIPQIDFDDVVNSCLQWRGNRLY